MNGQIIYHEASGKVVDKSGRIGMSKREISMIGRTISENQFIKNFAKAAFHPLLKIA